MKYSCFPTQEVIGGEVVSVPHLQVESGGNLRLRLVPGEQRLLARYHDLLFRHKVVEREDEPPVEVALTGQRPGR